MKKKLTHRGTNTRLGPLSGGKALDDGISKHGIARVTFEQRDAAQFCSGQFERTVTN